MTEKPDSPFLKLALEIGPLAVFFLSFTYGREIVGSDWASLVLGPVADSATMRGDSGPLFVATAAFMVAITISLTVSWAMTRTLPKMAVVTAVVVVVFGGLTLWLQDETFIKMKPTIVNAVFAAILGVGLLQGRSYIKLLMGEAIPMDDAGWIIFTRRWCLFFLFLGVLNEAVWRTQTTDTWVAFKTFANLPLTLAFMVAQVPLMKRHSTAEDESGA